MSKKKSKRKKQKTDLPSSGIPKTANTTRFLIFLAIGVVLFCIFMYYVITRGALI